MEKTITIGECEVKMTSNAFTPIEYKSLFNEDLLTSLSKLSEENLDIEALSKLAYCMALQADDGIEDFKHWLGQFEISDFYSALPDIMAVWTDSTKQESKPKKPQGK